MWFGGHHLRFKAEIHRVFQVLETRLPLSDYIGPQYITISILLRCRCILGFGDELSLMACQITHGKTKKTSWSAVVIFQMVCRVTVTHCSLGSHQCSRAHDVLQRLWFVSQSKIQLLQGAVVKVCFLI